MNEILAYEKYPAGSSSVRLLIPSRRKDKQLLDPGLITEMKTKVQGVFQDLFGGTAPEEPARIGTWQHDDGSITREEIHIVESSATIESLQNQEYRNKIEILAADVCRHMDQDCVFVCWGEEAFLVDDQRSGRQAKTIKFNQLHQEAQRKMIHICWMGINNINHILQVLSLNCWEKTKLELEENGAILFAENHEAAFLRRLWLEPSFKQKWPKKTLQEGDSLISETDNGVALRLFNKNKFHGPKILHFSNTEATPKTFQLLNNFLCEDVNELCDLLDRKDIRTGFFKNYQLLLNELEESIEDNKFFKKTAFNQAQLILGRLMFIKFIEQKEWLNRDRHYLRNYYNQRQGNFYQTRLLPLFFDKLNTQRPDSPDGLPFINGGLFHPRENEYKLDIPDEFFERVLHLFDSYEFTLDEAPGSDDAIAVDPSMFGKVLESLVEPDTRKKSGIHYTPKPIAHALAFEAIIARLAKLLQIQEDELRQFCYGQIANLSAPQAAQVQRTLSQLHIIDPAVGSGGLLLACLEVMMKISEYCHERMGQSLTKGAFAWGRLCRHFVCNCLFGVDISEIAVEIARLRLWLAVAVADISPTPLPDLEFNILQADSLLEDEEASQKITHNQLQLLLDLDEFTTLKNKYNNAVIEYQKSGVDDPIKQHELMREVKQCQKNLYGYLRRQVEDTNKPKKGKKIKRHEDENLIRFSWELHFRPIFQETGGFDIVIANPPYVRVQNIDKVLKDKYKNKWKILKQGSPDLYYAFIQLAIEIAAPDGEISFINPNFSRTAAGASLRQMLSDNVTIRRWVDFDDTQIFSEASNYVSLLFARKGKSDLETFPCSCVRDKSWVEQSSTKWIFERDPEYLIQIFYGSDTWLTVPRSQRESINNLRKNPKILGDLVKISVGVQTSCDQLYLFEGLRPAKNDLVEIYSRGIKHWCKIERGLLKKCIKGARGLSSEGTGIYCLWPYNDDKKLIPMIDIEKNYPHGWKYFKKIEKKLRKRENGIKFDDAQWYRFGRKQGIETSQKPKIIIPAILNRGTAIIDKQGELTFTASGEGGGGAWGLVLKEENSIQLEKLADYLRSEVVWHFIQAMGFPKQNGWRGVDQSVLTMIPVPF